MNALRVARRAGVAGFSAAVLLAAATAAAQEGGPSSVGPRYGQPAGRGESPAYPSPGSTPLAPSPYGPSRSERAPGQGASSSDLSAKSYGFSRGTWELRPVIGMTGNLAGLTVAAAGQLQPPNVGALQLGLDVFYHLGGGTALLFGGWGSTDEGFIGAEAHIDVKHRFFGINPVVIPTVLGGIGFQWALPRAGKDRRTVTGAGVRMGFGLDFQASPRVFPGIQFVLDLGPRFLPNVSVMATTQVIVGVGFVL